MTIMLKLTVAKWANAFMISWAHTKEMVANASVRAESFTPDSYNVKHLNFEQRLGGRIRKLDFIDKRYCTIDLVSIL